MEEYIKLKKKNSKAWSVLNWQISTYGKIRVDDDLYELRSMEAEFPAIVIDDAFTPQDALPCKSQAKVRFLCFILGKLVSKDGYGVLDFIILDMPEDIKVPLILRRPFLSTSRAKIDVYKRKITLRVGEERIIIQVLNLSLDPFFEDYIELNDLNEPSELRRNQGDDLMPTIEEGKVIEEFRTSDDELDIGIDYYPSYCDYDKKIHIDFLEDMDAYRDKGMDDVIFGEPFLREVGIKIRQFEGAITI
ncbi:hypothetical protein Tco_0089008 [Tanacetum coccineum]